MLYLLFQYLSIVNAGNANAERYRMITKAAHSFHVLLFAVYIFVRADYAAPELFRIIVFLSDLYYATDICMSLMQKQVDVAGVVHHLLTMLSSVFSFYYIATPAEAEFVRCGFVMFGLLDCSSVFALPLRLRLLERDKNKFAALNRSKNNRLLPQWLTLTVAGSVFAAAFFFARFVLWPLFLYQNWHLIPTYITVSILIPLLLLNCLWLHKLIDGIRKEKTLMRPKQQ